MNNHPIRPTSTTLVRTLFAIALAMLIAPGARAASSPVGAGGVHSAALGSDGVVRTWGDDSYGQLGIGRPLVFASPAAVTRATGVKAISAGAKHVLALKLDGTVLAWGQNQNGELGDGTTLNRSTPVPVMGLNDITVVSAGNGYSSALKADGTVWIWGSHYGAVAFRVDGIGDVQEISSGGDFTLARKRDGTVWAWGENESGQLGDGTRLDPYAWRIEPRAVVGLSNVAQVAAGVRHALARMADGTVRAWGSNEGGALGDGTTVDRSTPVSVVGLGGVTSIAAGVLKSIAIRGDGSVLTWGNGYYALGDGVGGDHTAPVPLAGLSGAVAIAAGFLHSFALISGGTLAAWGINTYGQLGDGTTQDRVTPAPMTSISGVSAIGVGGEFTVALKTDGSVFAWGDNTYGQLGNGAFVFRSTPSAVSLAGVGRLAVGSGHTVAQKTDGSLWAWGGNISAQIGDGTSTNRSSPVAVAGLGAGSGIVDISAGEAHTLALRNDGSVLSWGDNYSNGLGDRESADASVPSRVLGLSGMSAVAAGKWGYSVALKDDGTVWTWGHDNYGQLGDGTRTALYGGRSKPMAVPGFANAKAVAAGRAHVVALKNDGTLWAWGGNFAGQLGDGTRIDRLTPVQIASALDNVIAIAAGAFHTLALKVDGTVWMWGESWSGDVAPPAQVSGLSAIVAISASNHSLALKGDGSVWAWGFNSSGQLGDGTLISRYSAPVVVLRERGAGSIAGNDWFLDLNPAVPTSIPPESVPVFLVQTAQSAGGLTASFKYRAQDVGSTGSVYVFALVPSSLVKDRIVLQEFPAIHAKTKSREKDGPVQCVLAQLNLSGQLQSVSAQSLQAYTTGVLSAQGESVSLLSNASSDAVAGATFFVGYGSNPGDMLSSGTNRGVVSVPGVAECHPQAPQKGWWWNPSEGGRGYSIEVNGNHIFYAAYLYDVTGRTTWLVATGNTSLDGSLFTSNLYSFSGGQTLGGASAGTLPPSQVVGSITLAFSDATHGTMAWPGPTVAIERFSIVPNGLAIAPGPSEPESGWWWNPQEPGRGFFLEWQGKQLFMAGYMYDEAGNPLWYLSGDGQPSGNLQTYSNTWQLYGGGQTLTGPYKPPTQVNGSVAPVTIQFQGAANAIMTLPGNKTTAIQRFRF